MKAKLLRVLLLVAVIFTMNSCSSDSSEENPSTVAALTTESDILTIQQKLKLWI